MSELLQRACKYKGEASNLNLNYRHKVCWAAYRADRNAKTLSEHCRFAPHAHRARNSRSLQWPLRPPALSRAYASVGLREGFAYPIGTVSAQVNPPSENSADAKAIRRGDHRGQVSKSLSEGEACVSAEPESGRRAHGVRDAGFAFLPLW